jgi:5-methylcytosine-specific restriction enzyme subunit McrC
VSAGPIPIRNIYFLLCYAWRHRQELRYVDRRTEGCESIADLMAVVLAQSAQQLVKRGLHRDYILHRDRLLRPKGKILPSEDVRRPLFTDPRRTCEFDDLSPDTLPNRIIAETIRRLAQCEDVDEERRHNLAEVGGYFSGFRRLVLDSRVFRRVQIHRNMRHYRFALNVCKLVHRQLLPTEEAGNGRFHDFQREARMGALFEEFVRNFLATEQSVYRVSAATVSWDVDEGRSSKRGLQLLPTMRTDIRLESETDKVIVDCKFYAEAFQSHFDTQKFISGHLYQLLAYLRNQSVMPGWSKVRGMLLYPVNGTAFDERVTIQGHEIRVVSIDLGKEHREIATGIKNLVRTGTYSAKSS